MNGFNKIRKLFEANRQTMLGAFALVLIGFAFYNPALRLLPVDFDDLVLLSHVKNSANPLTFFTGDWGFGNYGFRPLHTLSLWLVYQFFGVSSGPNQLINLCLNLTVILLLYALLLKIQKKTSVAFIFSAVSLISIFTFSPPTWISDRPTLLVSICLLTLLNHLFSTNGNEKTRTSLLVVLSMIALMSKESGLLVPLIACIFFLFIKKGLPNCRQTITSLLAVIFLYGMLRFVLFGSNAGEYYEAGYLFGTRYYQSAAVLPFTQRLFSFGDNVIKNIIAVFLPIFDGQGKLSLIGTPINSFVLISTTFSLALLAFTKKLTPIQWLALAIILFNAALHFQVFRYRTLYLGQIGFSIFLSGSNLFSDEKTPWKTLAFAAAALLVLWSTYIVGEDLTYIYLDRYNLLQRPDFESWILSTSNRIDPAIIQQIIAKYRH